MTLYRKYRPQLFADFINQKPIKLTISNQIAQGKTVHAYLFTGPRGVGKTTMARLMAKALNCKKRIAGKFEPCNECNSCMEISKGNSLDIVEMDAASNRGIDEVRTLKEKVRYAPGGEMYKIFIIDEAHMLTTPAWNALLKTLEEPPTNALFILATTEAHKLPDTIVSRCQRFDFKKLREDDIESELKRIAKSEGFSVGDDIVEAIAARSGGGMRDALSVLGQVITSGSNREEGSVNWGDTELVIPRSNHELLTKFVEFLESKKSADAMSIIRNLAHEGADFDLIAQDLLVLLRDRLHKTLESGKNPELLVRFIDIFLKRYADIKQASFLPELPFELGVLECIYGPSMSVSKEKNVELKTEAAAITAAIDKEQIVLPKKPLKNLHSDTSQDMAEVLEKWRDISDKAKVLNNSLPVALSFCKPVRLEANTLVLGFKFKLHENIVSQPKNRSVLETLIDEAIGRKFAIKGEIVEDWDEKVVPKVEEPDSENIRNIEKVFGVDS